MQTAGQKSTKTTQQRHKTSFRGTLVDVVSGQHYNRLVIAEAYSTSIHEYVRCTHKPTNSVTSV
jgi:hypothetical protein